MEAAHVGGYADVRGYLYAQKRTEGMMSDHLRLPTLGGQQKQEVNPEDGEQYAHTHLAKLTPKVFSSLSFKEFSI